MKYDALLSKTVAGIPPSGIRRFFNIVNEVEGAISLGIGEPDFETPWGVRQAGIESLQHGETHYTANAGLLDLRAEISRYMQERFCLTYRPDKEVVVTVGASEGIDIALRALINPGDEVLVVEPSYVSYRPCIVLSGGVPVALACKKENGFRVTGQMIKEKITPRTKAIILTFPNNPTGAILDRDNLEDIASVLRGTDIFVISDEIYAELTYGGRHVSIATLPGMWERTIVLNGFSKAFAMTGWRLGYACAPEPILSAMTKVHQYVIMCASTTAQRAGIAALSDGYRFHYDDVARMVRSYDKRRQMMLSAFSQMGLPCFEPLGAFYCFPEIGVFGLDSEEFCQRLLREEKLAVIPGTAFGPSGEGHVRCCYATSVKVIDDAMERLGRFINRLGRAGT
nr:aminotransferase class I/II-fold pyridoxal phosphate-dependent enzyme [bacterium]